MVKIKSSGTSYIETPISLLEAAGIYRYQRYDNTDLTTEKSLEIKLALEILNENLFEEFYSLRETGQVLVASTSAPTPTAEAARGLSSVKKFMSKNKNMFVEHLQQGAKCLSFTQAGENVFQCAANIIEIQNTTFKRKPYNEPTIKRDFA